MIMEIKVNIVELASELADKRLREVFVGQIDVETDDEICYTEEAQDEFNYWYDEYFEIIFKCKSSDYGNN